ncbi:hypothetical protein BDE02_09G085300 [Populus trichocarpa]|nr:hypothetical protein BDE02_09G085300 [Populus trichocarpa]
MTMQELGFLYPNLSILEQDKDQVRREMEEEQYTTKSRESNHEYFSRGLKIRKYYFVQIRYMTINNTLRKCTKLYFIPLSILIQLLSFTLYPASLTQFQKLHAL